MSRSNNLVEKINEVQAKLTSCSYKLDEKLNECQLELVDSFHECEERLICMSMESASSFVVIKDDKYQNINEERVEIFRKLHIY